jgi:hypothetical protein
VSSGGGGRSSEIGGSEGGGSIISELLKPTLKTEKTRINTLNKVKRFIVILFIVIFF